MICDLCSKTILDTEITCIPAKQIQEAVAKGFNPFKTQGIDMTLSIDLMLKKKFPQISALGITNLTPETRSLTLANLGLSYEDLLFFWRLVVDSNTTDWGLCCTCAAVFRTFTLRQFK